MSKVAITKEKLTAVADAIREKAGTTEELTLDEMPTKIAEIETGGGDVDCWISGVGQPTEFSYDGEEIKPYLYYGVSLNSIDLPNAKEIGNYAFYFSSGYLNHLNIPNVEMVRNYALFYRLNDKGSADDTIKFLDFPKLVNIFDYSFSRGTAIQTLNIPEAAYIGDSAFSYCNKMISVNAPKVTRIRGSAFNNCVSLKIFIANPLKKLAHKHLQDATR